MGKAHRWTMDLTHIVATYGVWLVAAFVALESIGAPLPAEAALIAAGIFAATTRQLDVGWLVAAAIPAAIVGNIAGYWIGRKFGYSLMRRYGRRIGLDGNRIKVGQWLFFRYGGRFVFTARFLPFLRNMAALLAGVNRMPISRFYIASTSAAMIWVTVYGLGAYALGEAFAALATPAAVLLGVIAVATVVGLPMLILRFEKRLLAEAERELPTPDFSSP